MKRLKIFVSLFLSLVLIFSFVITGFAASDYSFFLDTAYVSHALGTVSVVRQSRGGLSCSRVIASDSGDILYFYNLPSGLIAGQSYTVSFKVQRYSGANARLYFYVNNSNEVDISSEEPIYYVTLADIGSPNTSSWTSSSFSFVYSGSSRLHIIMQPTSIAPATNNFTAWFTAFELTRYNPNAELESQNAEIISQNEEQNSLLEEQNSWIEAQNSLVDDQNSKLFDDGETFPVDDVDLSEFNDSFSSSTQDLLSSLNDMMNDSHIVNGVIAFSSIFTWFWRMLNAEHLMWIRYCIYLTISLSVMLMIVKSFSWGEK